MKYFGQELFELAEATTGLNDPVYLDARALCLEKTRSQGTDKVMAEEHLDAMMTVQHDSRRPLPNLHGPSRCISHNLLSQPRRRRSQKDRRGDLLFPISGERVACRCQDGVAGHSSGTFAASHPKRRRYTSKYRQDAHLE